MEGATGMECSFMGMQQLCGTSAESIPTPPLTTRFPLLCLPTEIASLYSWSTVANAGGGLHENNPAAIP